MTRTFRRSKKLSSYDKYIYCSNVSYADGTFTRIPLALDSLAYLKSSARYHSDSATYPKEPGPAWFRNQTSERPHRQNAKKQIRKFIHNPEFEVMVRSMPKLEYYT